MAPTIQLRIITAESTEYEGEATFVRIPGVEGDFGVQGGHQATMTMVRTGELKVVNGLDETYLFVSGGFVEVTKDRVLLLADVAERVESIDPQHVEEARKRAEEALERNSADLPAAAALERALYQLKLVDIHHRRGGGQHSNPLSKEGK